jgi:pimeloyl-ACP methyl ester carboxylesterase
MTEPHIPIQAHVQGINPMGFHKIAYTQWGEPTNPNVLICVHGVSRNCRDFDYLARELAKSYRVICPDVVGRGVSDYSGNPATYNVHQYVCDMTTLLARVNAETVYWLGTSMGGMIGIVLAAQANTPIKKLVLNDVGMSVPTKPLKRILNYIKNHPHFPNMAEANVDLRRRLSTFGIKDPEHWDHILKHSFLQNPDSTFSYNYDPAIIDSFVQAAENGVELGPLWQAVQCPTLIIRGETSDLLLPETVEQMIQLKPNTDLVTIPGCGHAPALMSDDQIKIVGDWLSVS